MNKPVNLPAQARAHMPASEATAVEQQRAIAQVQGALVVAQQRPRDEIRARERMENACQVQSLAERAFFRFPRGGQQITGPSIHLATELARCWGNVDYGITELRRDDIKGESEMLSYAWDLETNNRVTNSFIVPHKRDKRGGPEVLTDMRDIYENNANAAARRLRECIFRVLPTSFLEEAKSLCMQTLEHGGGEPIEQRRTKLLEAFAALGVSRAQIEKKIGRPADRLSAYDIGVLRVVFQSIKRGEAQVADEFPSDAAGAIQSQLQGAKGNDAVVATPTPPAQPKDALFDDLPTQIDPKWADYIEKRALDIAECEDAESLGTVREGLTIAWANGDVPQSVQDELTRQIAEKEKKLAAKGKRK